jgi:molecular chaperone GrpE
LDFPFDIEGHVMKEHPTDQPEDTPPGTEAAESAGEPGAEHQDEPAVDIEGAEGAEDWPAEGALAELRLEFDDLNDRHLRLAAEFNNFRRRSEQERKESWARAQADLLGRMLEVLDDLERVADLDTSNATVEAIMEGIDLVERKFVRALADTGVEIIDPHDEAFDPERMEALMRVPTDDEAEDDQVAQVFQKGYALKGVLVRPARVSVSKHG